MMKALFLGALLSLPVAFAEAQSCVKSINLNSVCGSSQVRQGSAVCLNGDAKSIGSATSSCQSATLVAAQLNNLCLSSCKTAPPPVATAVSIRSAFKNKSLSATSAKIQFTHYSLDLLWCMDLPHNHILNLSTADRRNAALLSQPAASQWLSVNLVCPSAPKFSQDPNTGAKTTVYPEGCYVTSFGPSSQPSQPLAQCY